MKYSDIKGYTRPAYYKVNVDWEYLEGTIKRDRGDLQLSLNPDFQRGHIWTKEQQIAYIEFKLRGGTGSNDLYFNCTGWMDDFKGPYQLVDGKQRLEAVRAFMNNEIKAFEYLRKDFTGYIPTHCEFIWHVNNLKTRKEVLRWYLEMNEGGVVHTQEELQKVQNLLNKEK